MGEVIKGVVNSGVLLWNLFDGGFIVVIVFCGYVSGDVVLFVCFIFDVFVFFDIDLLMI